MTATEVPAPTVAAPPAEAPSGALGLAAGVTLLGPVQDSGYKDGAALVRRADGQMVQLGPLAYCLLECIDGRRDGAAVAEAMTARLHRQVTLDHVARLAEKMSAQGLLAGTEHAAPPRQSPLLALRWKVLVTNPKVTRRITAPFAALFHPVIMWPVLAAFVVVCWFVLVDRGVAGAASQAFHSPGLLLLVFALGVFSAGVHELGHAAACRYGGATPGGMGMGLYLVWPAFYTDVTDAYRLDRRSRLRVDLAGLYFNAAIAVATMAVWLAVRTEALLLLVALQLLQMVKQLSPVIRADGYHILADATGVPDLYAHMGPTLRRLLPGHRGEPSALTGRARLLVTVWVLVIIPVLLSLMLSAVLMLPKLATTAWYSGRHLATGLPHQASTGNLTGVLASVLQLCALFLPVVGSVLVTQKSVRMLSAKARRWSAGRAGRRVLVGAGAATVVAGLAWAWWPAHQYQPIRPTDRGTIGSLFRVVASPASAARPAALPAPVRVAAGHYLALSMVPVGGPTPTRPAVLFLPGGNGHAPVAILSGAGPVPALTGGALTGGSIPAAGGRTTVLNDPGGGQTTITSGGVATSSGPVNASAFPFTLPADPGARGTQAVALNTVDGGVTYNVAYALVTVSGGAPVTETNSAFAVARCQACTTVAVSYQVVLVVGQSKQIAPINAAGALNYGCPACTTTALADQMVLTLRSQPSAALQQQLYQTLEQLDVLPLLGANGTPSAIGAVVTTVQNEVQAELTQSGLLAAPIATTPTSVPATSSTTVAASTSTTLGATTPSTVATSGGSSSGGTSGSGITSGGRTSATTAPYAGGSSSTGSSATTTPTTATSPTTSQAAPATTVPSGTSQSSGASTSPSTAP